MGSEYVICSVCKCQTVMFVFRPSVLDAEAVTG